MNIFNADIGSVFGSSHIPDRDFRISSACGIAGIMNKAGKKFNGEMIFKSMEILHERGNGLGAGFAAYGIYPQFKDLYCFHMLYDDEYVKKNAEEYLRKKCKILESEPIPTRKNPRIRKAHILWRYFLKPLPHEIGEEDYIISIVMSINEKINGAFVISSGKNMGIFKGVGYPKDIGDFYKIDEYDAYIWTAHNRFPTNTSGWWGGAHPFGILDWSVVHNGEISSYGTNKRFLETHGYKCNLSTDTEVITYLMDLFMRRMGYSCKITSKILSAPLWSEIDKMSEREKNLYTTLRINYSPALLNGPFAIIVANNKMMMGLNDRIKLRPLVAALNGEYFFISSEESAIRVVCKSPEKIWTPKAGEPVVEFIQDESRNKNFVKTLTLG